jgi:LuxR family transcriptional regulator, quorum-sensing system regulator BjaR1
MLPERLLAFAAAAPGLQTKKALVASFTALIETLGATRFACLYLRREGAGLAIERSIHNLPRLWQELYLERGFDAVDPVLQATARGAWGYWNELIQGVSLTKAAREVMTSAREFDMKDGFTKRISLDAGGTAVMMVTGTQLTRSDRARAAFRMSFEVFANEGVRMLKLAEEPSAAEAESRELSKTQLKVLVMRSEGMSNKQVAQAMGRHEKTVECHVTEILRRLGARNMIDAIRIATRQKLIL